MEYAPCRLAASYQGSISTKNTAPKSLRHGLRGHAFAKPFDCRFDASLAVRDAQRVQPDLADAESPQDPWGIDVAHRGNEKRLPGEIADADAENDAAFFLAIAMQRGGTVSVVHDNGGHGVGALAGFRDVEPEHLPLRPYPYRAARCSPRPPAPPTIPLPRGGPPRPAGGGAGRHSEAARRTACPAPDATRT